MEDVPQLAEAEPKEVTPPEEMPLPATPPGELAGGLVTDPASPMKDAARSSPWAPSWLKGKRWDAVNSELSEVPLVMPLARRLSVAPVVVGLGFLLLAITFLLYGLGGQLVCTVFGVAYPAFESFKAVEEFANLKDTDEIYRKASGMQFWLTYWIVLAAITSFECMLYYVVVWIPFYFPLKLTLLLYLYAPRVRGANHVYHWFVSPVLKRNRESIDHTLEESGKRLRKSVSNVATTAVDAGFGVGKQGVAQIKRGMTLVKPGLETVRQYVGAELRRRSTAPAAAAAEVAEVAQVAEAAEVAEAIEPEEE